MRHSFKDNVFVASMDSMASTAHSLNRHSRREDTQVIDSAHYDRIIPDDVPNTYYSGLMENVRVGSGEDQFRARSNSSFSRPSKISLPPRSSRSEDGVDNKAELERAEKILKIVVIGTDKTIGQVTKAFIRLKHESPSIFAR